MSESAHSEEAEKLYKERNELLLSIMMQINALEIAEELLDAQRSIINKQIGEVRRIISELQSQASTLAGVPIPRPRQYAREQQRLRDFEEKNKKQ